MKIGIEYEPDDRVVERCLNERDQARKDYWSLFDGTDQASNPEVIARREQVLRRMDILASAKPIQGRSLRIGFVRIPIFPRILPSSGL